MSLLPENQAEFAALIDHTLLRADASADDIKGLCDEAREWGFHAVCVNGCRVLEACSLLEETTIKVAAVVGFPLGATDRDSKRFETEAAIDNGASEIDVVLNIGWLKEGNHPAVVRELRDIVQAADERVVKVILETGLLNREQMVTGCKLVMEAEAHFVKTSTGFLGAGATAEVVQLLRATAGSEIGVKASGGIRDWNTARSLIQAGANRLGCSASAAMMKSFLETVR